MNERCSNASAMAEKTAFSRGILINFNYGKEPLQILEEPAGSPFFPQKGVTSFTAGRHTMLPALQTRCCCLPVYMEITSTHPVGVSAWSFKTYV